MNLIKNSEERLISYKQLLGDVGRNRDIFPPDDGVVIWYKELLHWAKNDEEKWLKKLIEERTLENQGLNPFYDKRYE